MSILAFPLPLRLRRGGNPLLRLLQVPAEILPIAVNYLRIVFAGLIFTFFYNFLAATMRALGDSKSALYFLMISSVLNIGGDLFFVQQRLRPFHRGQRSTVLRAVRTVHPLEGAHPAAGQALAGV